MVPPTTAFPHVRESAVLGKRLRLCIVLGVALALLAIPQGASAATLAQRKAEAKIVADQIVSMDASLTAITKEYEAAYARHEALSIQIEQTRQQLIQTETELVASQNTLNQRVTDIYKSGRINLIDVLVGAKSFDQFMTRMQFMAKIAELDARAVTSVQQLKTNIASAEASLVAQRDEQRIQLSVAQQKSSEIETRLRDMNALLAKIKADIKKLAQAELARRRALLAAKYSTIPSARVGAEFVFPVAFPYSWSGDDWHAPRVGHLHQGTDIFAAIGTPLYAVVNGVIERAHPVEQGLGGITLWVDGDDGNHYYYAHMTRIKPGITDGVRVRSGEVVGFVGKTGNARTTPAHLHFEIHPGGGDAINPIPILSKYGRLS